MTLGGKHGIGIIDIVENRVVGMKSRGVYETPGGTILMEAHEQLEELVLGPCHLWKRKKKLGNKFAQIVYEGKWFTPLREAIQAFMDVTQEYVTGEVKFKLYKGNIIKAGTTSPYSLYSESLASFTTGELYDHHDARRLHHPVWSSVKSPRYEACRSIQEEQLIFHLLLFKRRRTSLPGDALLLLLYISLIFYPMFIFFQSLIQLRTSHSRNCPNLIIIPLKNTVSSFAIQIIGITNNISHRMTG